MADALIIPVHPPKANWMLFLLHSIARHHGEAPLPFRIVLATSDEADHLHFERMLPLLPCAASIDLVCVGAYIRDGMRSPALLERFTNNVEGCIVNVKKLAAIHWAVFSGGYEWIACIDGDTLAAGRLDGLFPTLARNYEDGRYFGAPFPEATHHLINATCRGLFSAEDSERLRLMTHNDVSYAWFFDAPTYRARDVRAFLDHMAGVHGDVDAFLCRITWHAFEHIVFLFWRCLHGGAAFIDYSSLGVLDIPEFLRADGLKRLEDHFGCSPAWVALGEALMRPEVVDQLRNVLLLYHTDRI